MKTTRILFAFLITGSLTLLLACGSGSSVSPSSTVKEFTTKVEKGDFDGAIGCIALEGKTLDKEAKGKLTLLLGMAKGELEKKKGVKNMEVISETIDQDGKTATVKIKFTFGDGSTSDETNKLVLEDGKWKMSMNK
jgi:hypothetical protein